MTEALSADIMEESERRCGERQVSVLINAGIIHNGNDALCRIRNLSSGGAMIECQLPLTVDDQVELQLRTGRVVHGIVRWVLDGRAGISFMDPRSYRWIMQRPATLEDCASPIGYPIFQREAWVKLAAGHKRGKARIVALSPVAIALGHAPEWPGETLLTVSIEGLGDYLARATEDRGSLGEDEHILYFAQPLHYRAFNDWLASQPRISPLAAFADASTQERPTGRSSAI